MCLCGAAGFKGLARLAARGVSQSFDEEVAPSLFVLHEGPWGCKGGGVGRRGPDTANRA